jgi:osmotically-inducible protein OsmY
MPSTGVQWPVKMLKLLSFLVTACLLAGLVLAADKTTNDDVIVDQVRIRLASDAVVKGGGLGVDCKSGVVTLSGVVANPKQKDRASKVAGKVKGVKQVVNNITIAPVGK